MIDYIEGTVAEVTGGYVVVETNGIGYRLFISQVTLVQLERGALVKLFAHLNMTDDGLVLYGFSTVEERNLFRLLLPVSRIGPKVSLQLLSALSPRRFVHAILNGELELLQSIKGIGRKTAERLILELKDRVGELAFGGLEAAPMLSRPEEMALQALRTLGFSDRQARRALERVKANAQDEEEFPTEEWIRKALEVIHQAH
ncbi:MAG: Holliday junction branch migration protein RuvA [Candidatus Bipolaricaulia bacterium]